MCNMWFRCIEFIGTRGGKTGQLKRGIMLIAEGYVMIAYNQMKPRMEIKKKQ